MTDEKLARLAEWFLKENGAYGKYICNVREKYADWGGSFVEIVHEYPNLWLGSWFSWYETPEGEQYWLDLFNKWMVLYNIVK